MGKKITKIPSKIDLVTAAQAEYEFLRMGDEHPALSKEYVVRNVIYRYEQYWLPLVAEYEEEFLPAPSAFRYRMSLALSHFESFSVPERLFENCI